jgi:hypothetical protein
MGFFARCVPTADPLGVNKHPEKLLQRRSRGFDE